MRFRRILPLCGFTLLACTGGVPLEDVPSEPIAFVHQGADSISDLEEFVQAVQLLRPRDRAANRARRPVRATVSLLTIPTGKIRPVPDAGEGTYPLDWSADGLRLLVGREERGLMQLFEWNRLTGAWDRVSPGLSVGAAALGGGPIRLAWVGALELAADRSEPGILLDVDREGRSELAGSKGGRDPDVSPDGMQVAFVRPNPRRARDPLILLAQLGGGEPHVIARGDQPRFSRDGQWITFVTSRRGNRDVWMMRADGTAKRPLVTSGFDEEFPALSPDGRFVVYASARDREISQLYMTRIEDGAEVQLTHTGQSGRPVW